jgi:biotin carboxylase
MTRGPVIRRADAAVPAGTPSCLEGRHVLFVNAAYLYKIATLQAAKRSGLTVSLVGGEFPDWARPYVDRFVEADTYDEDGTIEALRRPFEEAPFGGAVTFWDRDVGLVARICDAFGLPGCPVEAAARARNKQAAREAFADAGLPQPRFAPFTGWDELVEAARLIGFPLVCKPLGASGSKGIFRVDREADLRAAYALIERFCRPEADMMFSYHRGRYLAEEFMPGPEVSVEGFAARGDVHVVGVTEKRTTDDHYVEVGHAFPARLDAETARSVRALAADAVRALGLDGCGFHAEIKLTDAGPKVVEVNGRVGGDLISTHLVPLATGIGMVESAFAVALGCEPDLRPRRSRAACIRFLLAERSGTLRAWHVDGARSDLDGVVELAVEKEPGERVTLPPAQFVDYRIAYVVTEGDDTAAAVERADRALEHVAAEIV